MPDTPPMIVPRALDRAALERRRLPGFHGIAAVTVDGTIVHLSEALEDIYGMPREIAEGSNFAEYLDAEFLEPAASSFAAVIARPGYHPAIEVRLALPTGDLVVADVVAENCLETFGLVLLNLADARERSRSAHLLDAQAEVIRQIALGGSLDVAFHALARFVEQAMPGFSGMSYVEHAGVFAAHGDRLPTDAVRRVRSALAGSRTYVGSQALIDREPKVTAALPDDPLWADTQAVVGDAARCVWSSPIRHDRDASSLGCIEIYGPEPVLPRDEDWVILQLISRLAAIAIDHSAMQERLSRDANVDPLTGIPNRRVITDLLAAAIEHGRRPVVCFIDLDHLKVVNDGLGHEAGDQVIVTAARRLRRALPGHVAIGRFGGDEFVAIAEADATPPDALGDVCLSAFADPVVVGGRRWHLSASIGVVAVTDQTSSGEVLRDADAAMYEAKRAGRGRWVRFGSSTRLSVVRRLRLEQHLHQAVADRTFQAWFQPVVRCSDWQLVGVEALARWQVEEGEWVPPNDFIPICEELGLVDDLGDQMIDHAVTARRALGDVGIDSAFVSVNISPLQLRSDRLVEHLARVGDAVRGWLQLEMTEQHIVDENAATLSDLNRLIESGVSLAIDDFGTGYSSLGALHRIPASTLKLDRRLTQRVDTDAGAAVVAAVVGVATAFQMGTVAEGVETVDQAARLRTLGVGNVQGYLFAKPEPLDRLVARLGGDGRWAWDVDPGRRLAEPGAQLSIL